MNAAAQDDGPGHLFVVRANLLGLDCDAWLLPTDDEFQVEAPWLASVGLTQPGRLPGYHWTTRARAQIWQPPREGDQHPVIVMGRVGMAPGTPAEVCVQRAAQVATAFVAAGAKALRRSSRHRRPRLAMPLIGTGAGGLANSPGDLLVPLVDALEESVRRHPVDVVLTVVDDLSWSAIQEARSRRNDPSDWLLPEPLPELAAELAHRASQQHLVLFMGAGVSADAGLPDWTTLLDAVAAAAGTTPAVIESSRQLDPRDRALLLERRLGSRDEFHRLVAEQLDTTRFGLTHALLASLRVEAAVTTNFDDLYERACVLPGDGSSRPTQLPYEPAVAGRPWLLKLHGDLARRDLVITRPDYLGAERERSALFGIVQAMLVTRHLLFAGYSLSDDDFHRLVDQIGAALQGVEQPHLGTVLAVDDPLWRELWFGSLDVVTPDPRADLPTNSRHLQVLLDLVNHLVADRSTFVLDERFRGLLSDDEIDVAARLSELGRLVRCRLPEGSHLRTTLENLLSLLGDTAAADAGDHPASAVSPDELRVRHCWEAVDRAAGDPPATQFKRRARLQQAQWRVSQGYPIGHQPMRARPGGTTRPIGSRIEIDYAVHHKVNLVSDAARRAAQHRLATPQRHQTLNADRLWADCLSSMPMCFSIFGPLWDDPSLAATARRHWFADSPAAPTAVHFEWSPGRRDPLFLGDQTAFDAAMEFPMPNGSNGIIGIETKYHEHAVREAPPSGPALERLVQVAERSGAFRPGATDEIIGSELQQLWRDHLLVLAMLQHPSRSWMWGRYALVYPEGNVSFARAAERYACLLSDTSTFVPMTLEHVLDPRGPLPERFREPLALRYLW